MKNVLTNLVGLIALTETILALPQPSLYAKRGVQTIHEFPNETWVENIAVRTSGELLVTLLTTPDLYQVDPFSRSPPALIHTFPRVTGLMGIAEIQPDIFATITGNLSLTSIAATNGSYSVWKVDLRSFKHNKHGLAGKPVVSKIADLPEAALLNGMTLLAPSSPYVLISDSALGVVWRLNYLTGKYKIVLDNALFKPVPGQIVLGINGIHTLHDSLYFTNSYQELLGRVPISVDGRATGPYEVIAYNGLGDDFALDKHGNAYITQGPGNALQQVTLEGKVTVLVGGQNSTVVEGDTSAAFGRTILDKKILYVVTNGGIAGPVAGTKIVGGKVLAIDILALSAEK